jgi:outer membrane protein assembly factor BamB
VRADGAITALSLAERTIYAASSDQYLYAIDGARGQQVWRRLLPAALTGRPARAEGVVLAGTKDGRVHFRDAATGEPLATYETQGPIVGSIAVLGPLAFFASEDQHLYAFDVGGRGLLWRYRAKGRIKSPPIVGGGKVYFVAEESLYAIELN